MKSAFEWHDNGINADRLSDGVDCETNSTNIIQNSVQHDAETFRHCTYYADCTALLRVPSICSHVNFPTAIRIVAYLYTNWSTDMPLRTASVNRQGLWRIGRRASYAYLPTCFLSTRARSSYMYASLLSTWDSAPRQQQQQQHRRPPTQLR